VKWLSEVEVRAVYRQGEDAMVGLYLQLQDQLRVLTERVAELERQQGASSQNSHKPPSSDGYRKPAPKSLRKKTGRRSGGQAGHPGSTLEMVREPDRIEAHWPAACAGCGASLAGEDREASLQGYEARQVHDVPPVRLAVTEHRAMRVVCACCGAQTAGTFPAGVAPGAQYGNGVRALGVYAQVYQHLPLARTCELLGDVVGRRVSEGSLVTMVADCAQRVAPLNAQIKHALSGADTVCVDETGVRVAGQLRWLHTLSTPTLTHYALDAKRSWAAHERIGILPRFGGVLVHDALSCYWTYAGRHGLCNAHLLRDLTALEDTTRQRWPTQLKTLLERMYRSVERARASGHDALHPALRTRLERAYDRWVRRALAANPRPAYPPGHVGRPRASPARNLAERLRDHKASVLRFLHDFAVPFDNNLAERDLRMMKLKQKISGCFRSEASAEHFVAIRAYLSTARKQGLAALHVLRALFDGQPVQLSLA
jgi:transposase